MNINIELAQSLLAGWVAGAIAGMVTTAVMMIFVVTTPAVRTRMPWADRLPVLAILMANGLSFGLTLVGLVLGAVFYNAGGRAEPVLFGLITAGACVALGGLYLFIRGTRGREAPLLLTCVVTCGLSFGVILPVLGSLDQ